MLQMEYYKVALKQFYFFTFLPCETGLLCKEFFICTPRKESYQQNSFTNNKPVPNISLHKNEGCTNKNTSYA